MPSITFSPGTSVESLREKELHNLTEIFRFFIPLTGFMKEPTHELESFQPETSDV